jgi:hypothetical protein
MSGLSQVSNNECIRAYKNLLQFISLLSPSHEVFGNVVKSSNQSLTEPAGAAVSNPED